MDPVRAAQPTADKLRREVRALRDGEASSISDRQCVALAARIAVEVAPADLDRSLTKHATQNSRNEGLLQIDAN